MSWGNFQGSLEGELAMAWPHVGSEGEFIVFFCAHNYQEGGGGGVLDIYAWP